MSDTTNHDLLFKSENHTNELADGELDERDLEAINGGVRPTQKITVSSLIDVVQALIQPPFSTGARELVIVLGARELEGVVVPAEHQERIDSMTINFIYEDKSNVRYYKS